MFCCNLELGINFSSDLFFKCCFFLLDRVNVYKKCIIFFILMDLVKERWIVCVRFGLDCMFDYVVLRNEINCVGFFVDFLYLYLYFCILVI